MTIQQLIERLQELEKGFGNCPVMLQTGPMCQVSAIYDIGYSNVYNCILIEDNG